MSAVEVDAENHLLSYRLRNGKKVSFRRIWLRSRARQSCTPGRWCCVVSTRWNSCFSNCSLGSFARISGLFSLTIDYRENYSAAGKIPGGYYKREGKPSDKEVLTSRLIDRPVRPLFPSNYFDQVQIIATVYSVDKEHTPYVLAIIASSLALAISKIPFLGPIGAVEICKVDGKWVTNPKYADALRSETRITFAGTEEGINMVEGSADEISEQDFIDAMFLAHEQIKKIVAWQKAIQQEFGVAKQPISDTYNWNDWEQKAEAFLTPERVKKVYIADKVERNKYLDELGDAFVQEHAQVIEETKVPAKVHEFILDQVLNTKLTELLFTVHHRVDGRKFDQIRQISVEVGLLPFTHGSALFTRGRTQALVSTTLGGGSDEQKFEGIMDEEGAPNVQGRFMLHYNFPHFQSVKCALCVVLVVVKLVMAI